MRSVWDSARFGLRQPPASSAATPLPAEICWAAGTAPASALFWCILFPAGCKKAEAIAEGLSAEKLDAERPPAARTMREE